jgi:hypothetical protein
MLAENYEIANARKCSREEANYELSEWHEWGAGAVFYNVGGGRFMIRAHL